VTPWCHRSLAVRALTGRNGHDVIARGDLGEQLIEREMSIVEVSTVTCREDG
jgi:hypothetical protein